ncbi:FtsQ-type POTRA domain-containing protein [Myxococcota bacterium]|nr:FtsQ-type POTRA domain-containing protein [Myxococcota bacterium]
MASWRSNRRRRTWGGRIRNAGSGLGRFLRWAVVPVLGILTGFGAVVGGHEAWTRVRESPRFLLREVRIAGEGELSREEVLAACGIVPGKTRVLGLDVQEVARRCLGDLRIRWARVETRLPDAVTVTLQRETPVLAVATSWGIQWMNRQGEMFAPWDALEGPGEVPLLVPVSGSAPSWSREELSQAVTLAGLYRRIDETGDLWKVEWDPALGARAMVGHRGFRAYLGFGPYGRKMERLGKALSVARSIGLPVGEIRVDGVVRPNRVVIRPSFAGAMVWNDVPDPSGSRGMP